MRPTQKPDQIFISYDNEEVYKKVRLKRGRGVTTTQRARAWLRRHTPKQHKRETVMPDDWNLPAMGEYWSFPDRKVAMLFKLTFGGI
mgnify:CR=1 FL=1